MRLVTTLLIVLTFASSVLAQDPQAVATSIDKGKAYLYSIQKPDGTWENVTAPEGVKLDNSHDGAQWGGRTALAVYALLSCGEKPTEPKLQKAIRFLHEKPSTGTYAIALKCLVWLQLPETDEVRKSIRRDATLLRQLARPVKTGYPVWDYGPGTRKDYSLSRAQYAALGLWAASEMNIEIPANVWESIEKCWEAAQTPEGGWKYKFPDDATAGPTTVAMTASALATLYIAQDFTKSGYYAGARGNATSVPIEKGMAYLAQNFQKRVAQKNEVDREFTYTQLYSIERTGLASGLRTFGPHDWYGIGARFLLGQQQPNGSFAASKHKLFDTLVNTSFAILFLQRGRTPVAFNKFDYTLGVTDPKTAVWNQRPRDIANVTRWLSRSLERELRWQIVAADAKLPALLESPILYLAGEDAVEFKPETQQLLKSYIEHGGLVVVNADVSKDPFARSIMSLGTTMFPSYEWRELPDAHPIWTNQNYKRDNMKGRVAIKALSNGVRELMLLLPTGDPARAWQLRNPTQRPEAWQTAANILSYATDKTAFYARGYSWLAPAPTGKAQQTLVVAQLKYQGNWNPEPEAINQLSRYATTTRGLAVQTQVVDAGQPIDKSVSLLLVSGTVAFTFDDATRKAIQDYTSAGGTVLFENAGGQGGFAASAEAEVSQMFGAQNLKRLAKDHAIFGKDLKTEYRPYNILSVANPTGPSLLGVESDGRVVAMLSREDLSAGWLGIPTDGITGYSPESARALMTQILATRKK